MQTKLTESKTKKVSTGKTAEDMASKQREISISEFFTKNRHLLGFDSPRRALMTAVKEAVDNSVEYSEPVLIRENGLIKLVKIGEYIDKKIKKSKNLRINERSVESSSINSVESFVYDDKTFKMEFKPISAIHRHKLHNKLYKITLIGNRETKVTGSHSVFVLKNGKIQSYPVEDIKVGDFVVVPRKKFHIEGVDVIDLRSWIKQLPSKINKNIIIKKVSHKFHNISNDWKRFDYIPLEYFIENNIEIPDSAYISIKAGRSSIPVMFPINYELMRILGYYASEGTAYNQCLVFSFGAHEKDLINDLIKCVGLLSSNLTTSKILAHKTAMTIKLNSEILTYLFKDLFKCGSRAGTKKVPSIVFNSSNEMQKEFLRAYIAGDGHIGNKVTMATISKDLAIGLKYLFVLNGMPFSESVKKECIREFKNHKSNCKKVYYLYYYHKKAFQNSPLSWIPVNESGLREIINALNPKVGSFNPHYRMINSRNSFTIESANADLKQAMIYKRNLVSDERIQEVQNLLNGDVGFLKVKDIEVVTSESPYVYDFSVPGSEKFLGGEGAIFLHNSLDACEEFEVLPEIKLEIKRVEEKRYTLVVEDNGPGIIKEQIPKIFGKLLYGSKFHKLAVSRGQQGIGISATALYAQLTTGKGIKILSRTSPQKPAHFYDLHLNLKTNDAEIITDEEREWEGKEHGIKLQVTMEAEYLKGKRSVDEYIKQTAIANPHATIYYKTPIDDWVSFERATQELPKEAKEIKPHPYGIELGILMRMLKDTEAKTLQQFLTSEFSRVSPKIAKEICEKASLYEKARPSRIARQEVDNLYKAIQLVKIMAPPTNCLTPMGEDILLKGLKKEVDAEFYAAVTRPPAVYRGNPFQIECCTGDSKIILEDGRIITIKKYVEANMFDKKVFSMDDNFKIKPSKVFMVHKFKNKHKILKITTKSGRELNLTANNEIPIIENGEMIWKKVEDAMVGEHVATPRVINILGKIPNLLDLLNPEHVKVVEQELVSDIMDKLKNIYGDYKKVAQTLNINYDIFKAYKRTKYATRPNLTNFKNMVNLAGLNFKDFKNKINNIRLVDTNFTNPHSLKIPELNEDVLYILGLLNSDGHISRKGIYFINMDESLHKSFGNKLYSLFGLSVKRYKKHESSVCNKTLYLVLKEIERILPTLPDNLITAWLKGFVDGDGWVSKHGDIISEIGIATAKKSSAELVQTMLLRLGIISKIQKKNIPKKFGKIKGREIKTKKIQYNISIRNLKNMRKFHSLISFRQIKRANAITEGIQSMVDICCRSNHDVIPLGNSLFKFREENNLFQYELGFSDLSIRDIEKNKQNMSRMNLQQMLSLEKFDGVMVNRLKLLAFSDILWDKIVNIELVPHEEFVYDLTVETGNFIANNIIMHNCAISFGGSIPGDGLVQVVRFANRVPLLYKQSDCAITKGILNTAWRNYGLSQSRGALPSGPAVLIVHMNSVWIPFTSESKESIASYPAIMKEIKLALQECGRKLASHVRKIKKIEHEQKRQKIFELYIVEVTDSLHNLTGENKETLMKHFQKIVKQRTIGGEDGQ